MLGIASDSSDAVFDPDYSSSLEDVVRRYAREFVRSGNALGMLYRAGIANSYSFSSWVPNWTGGKPCRTISTWRGTEGVFAASGSTHPQASVCTQDPTLLEVLGTHIDTVVKISSVSMQNKDLITVVNDAHVLIDELGVYPTGESLATVKLKAPIGSAVAPCTDDVSSIEDITNSAEGQEELDDPTLNNAFDWNGSFTAVHCVRDIVNLLQQPNHKHEKSWKYWTTAAAFMKRLSDGRFFVTKRGYVGVGPPQTRVGDRVFVLHGGAVPFLVRRSTSEVEDSRNGIATLVGEAYVHGIMYGKAMEFDRLKHKVVVLA